MKRYTFLIFFLTALFLFGCAAGSPAGENIPPVSEAVIATEPPLPPPAPTEMPAPAEAPTPTPYTPFTVSSMVDHANIRTNPGKLFEVIASASQGGLMQVLGKAPGGEWFFIRQENGVQGWIFGQLLETDQDLQAVPVFMPANVMVLEGRIMKENGQPVSGIQFAFVQEQNGQMLRNDGNSDENGIFFVFMPVEISGTWTVSYTAISCSSNTMDAACNCLEGVCGTVAPSVQTITLPQVEPVLFSWVYAQ
jgi:hypothetical protein